MRLLASIAIFIRYIHTHNRTQKYKTFAVVGLTDSGKNTVIDYSTGKGYPKV